MVIRFGALSKVLSSLMYKDRLSSRRKIKEKQEDGSTGSLFLDSFLNDEPCLVHQTSGDYSQNIRKDVARKEMTVRIFCSNELDIIKGDELILSIMSEDNKVAKKVTGFAAEPTYFNDHLEIDLYDWSVGE